MSFRVIEGGGAPPPLLPGTIESDRAVIIDRVAGAIYASDDPLPDYMDWASYVRQAGHCDATARSVAAYRAQARLAIAAFRPCDAPGNEDVALAHHVWGPSPIGSTPPSELITDLQSWIDEVLK